MAVMGSSVWKAVQLALTKMGALSVCPAMNTVIGMLAVQAPCLSLTGIMAAETVPWYS